MEAGLEAAHDTGSLSPSPRPDSPPPPLVEGAPQHDLPGVAAPLPVVEDALDADGSITVTHPIITGRPCSAAGAPLLPDAPAPPRDPRLPNDYSPYESRPQFELADFLFKKEQMSAGHINELMQLWAATLPPGQDPPFANARDLYESIDNIPLGDIPWQEFRITYTGVRPEDNVPPWMIREYTVWFRCPRRVLHTQVGNTDFAHDMDYVPKQVFHGDQREYKDFMSGDWCWQQADIVAQDPANTDATFCPVILGSDKTTVSVATGQNEYYPLYLSNGLVRNAA
ncbi:hypothetical protein BC628DRAFT_1503960 [Trametes gibbosa]|nr:hypothetical protein BC628DRAFT_1503960 [Trametes gibbosa]